MRTEQGVPDPAAPLSQVAQGLASPPRALFVLLLRAGAHGAAPLLHREKHDSVCNTRTDLLCRLCV